MAERLEDILRQLGEAYQGAHSQEHAHRADRHTVVTQQILAPYDGARFPYEDEFRSVLCLNVSVSGIALLVPRRPEWQEAVVGLGIRDKRKYMRAKIVRRHPVDFADREHCFVGLQFLGELEPPKYFLHPHPRAEHAWQGVLGEGQR